MSTSSILVVDDDRDITSNFIDILTDQGYQAESANDGTTALTLVRQRSYDLALLDFKMPDMDGATLFEEIRGIQPELVAIMITAYAGSNGVHRAKQAGVRRVMRKPLDIASFLETLESLECCHAEETE